MRSVTGELGTGCGDVLPLTDALGDRGPLGCRCLVSKIPRVADKSRVDAVRLLVGIGHWLRLGACLVPERM